MSVPKSLIISIVNLGVFRMSYRIKAFAAAALSLATLAPMSFASAADLPVKAKAKPIADLPFFFVIDDRVTYSWMPKGTDPGAYSVQPNGSINGKTAKSVYSFTHFDAWAYGTNFFTISMFKSDHNDPASPCTNAGTIFGAPANCAGATEIYGLFRSTFGWNEIFNTKAFTMGPLHNVSFEVGMDANSENTFLAPAKRDFVAGLQFAFDLPYKGYFNVAPLAYKEINHNAFDQCGLFGPGVPGVTCLADGNTDFKTTWAIETNYYMDLGFLPENMQFFSISGRAAWYGPKGDQNSPLAGLGVGRIQHRDQNRVQRRTDPPDLRRQQGLHGPEILSLRRRLGRLSLLAEQVRPRSQRFSRRLHHRGDRSKHQQLYRIDRLHRRDGEVLTA